MTTYRHCLPVWFSACNYLQFGARTRPALRSIPSCCQISCKNSRALTLILFVEQRTYMPDSCAHDNDFLGSFMQPTAPWMLVINGGSSSIKFAGFGLDDNVARIFTGKLVGIGGQASLSVERPDTAEVFTCSLDKSDYASAIATLAEWIVHHTDIHALIAIGHRIVHGGPELYQPQIINAEVIAQLRELTPLDTGHLPDELQLVEEMQKRFPDTPQIACFDTAFHRHMPAVAQRLAIPRRYAATGVRRYGFHGISCEFVMQQLAQLGDVSAASGRVIIAHLGNGASLTAVRNGKSMDSTMGFTPAGGLPMSSRSGDIDPGLAFYFTKTQQMTAAEFHHMVNRQSGLLGISGISADIRELLRCEAQQEYAAEAIAHFCYHIRKTLCAFTGVLEGLDHLVFCGGIGENIPEIRARICAGLEFIGIKLDPAQNLANAAVISSAEAAVSVRVIPTDEECVIAQNVRRVLDLTGTG